MSRTELPRYCRNVYWTKWSKMVIGQRTEQVKTRQVNFDHLTEHFRGNFRGRVRRTFRGSFVGVLEGLKTGKPTLVGPAWCGRSRGGSRGRTHGPTRGPTSGTTRRGSRFALGCSVCRPVMTTILVKTTLFRTGFWQSRRPNRFLNGSKWSIWVRQLHCGGS